MKAYLVRRRLGISGGEIERPVSPTAGNPYEVLDRTYGQAGLDDVENGVELVSKMNNPGNPICLAMTIDEARRIVEKGPDIRHRDMGAFLDKLDKGTLVIVEPIGKRPGIQGHDKYLLDLALSGEEFPPIDDEFVYPLMFGKVEDETVTICPIHHHFDIVLEMYKGQKETPTT